MPDLAAADQWNKTAGNASFNAVGSFSMPWLLNIISVGLAKSETALLKYLEIYLFYFVM